MKEHEEEATQEEIEYDHEAMLINEWYELENEYFGV